MNNLVCAILSLGMAILALPNAATAQCPPHGDTVMMRFNVGADTFGQCFDDTVYLHIEVGNPGTDPFQLGSMSARFHFDTTLLSRPYLAHRNHTTGFSSIQYQNNVVSYGYIELFGTIAVQPGTWRRIATVKFAIKQHMAAGDSCVRFHWHGPDTTPASTINEYITFSCQPSMIIDTMYDLTACLQPGCCPFYFYSNRHLAECHGDDGLAGISSLQPNASYLWSNGDTSKLATGLDSGAYSLTVTYDGGCKHVQTFLVDTARFTAQASITDVSQIGANDGRIEVALMASGPMTISWQHGPDTLILDSLADGTYTLQLTDTTGCSKSFVYDVHAPPSYHHDVSAVGSVYPNPASYALTVSSKATILQVTAWSMSGENVPLHTALSGRKATVIPASQSDGLILLEVNTSSGTWRSLVLFR